MKKIAKLIFLLQIFPCNAINQNLFDNKIRNYSYNFFNNNSHKNLLSDYFSVEDLDLHKFDFKNSILLNRKKINKSKKDILIFTSTGGGGHTATSNALKGYLKNDYNLSVVNFFDDVMGYLDDVRTFTFGRLSSEDFYNLCLKYKLIKLVNVFTRFGGWVLNSKYNLVEKATYNFINKFIPKPDLIISVIPMVNNVILSASQKLNIPFLVVTNDLDTVNYINGINKIDYDRFYYTLAFEDLEIVNKIKPANIPEKQIFFSGFPLRPEFFDKKKNKNDIFKTFNIPRNKNKVMILMGGSGSYNIYKYVKELSTYKHPMHIIACLGKDEALAKDLDTIKLPKHITISKIGFTDKIADLMAISQVIITKSGPGSICEAIASNLPMIVDKTNEIIRWENLNIEFVKKYNLGCVLSNLKDLHKELNRLLYNPQYRKTIKRNMLKLSCSPEFKHNITNIVQDIIA